MESCTFALKQAHATTHARPPAAVEQSVCKHNDKRVRFSFVSRLLTEADESRPYRRHAAQPADGAVQPTSSAHASGSDSSASPTKKRGTRELGSRTAAPKQPRVGVAGGPEKRSAAPCTSANVRAAEPPPMPGTPPPLSPVRARRGTRSPEGARRGTRSPEATTATAGNTPPKMIWRRRDRSACGFASA